MSERRVGVTHRAVLGLLSALSILGSSAPAAVSGTARSTPTVLPARAEAPRPDRPAAAGARPEPVPASVAKTNRVVVRWSDVRSTDAPAVAAAAARKHLEAVTSASGHAARFVRTIGSGSAVYELGSKLGPNAKRTLAALRRIPGARSVEPDLWMTAEALPNDPKAANLWGLLGPGDGSPYGIDVLPVWSTTTGAGIVVGLVE